MSKPVINLFVDQDPIHGSGELLLPVSRATIDFFDSFEPSSSATRISFNSFDGLSAKDLSAAQSMGSSDFHCISQACVSDASVFESSASIASVEPGLLASFDTAGIIENMSEQISFQTLNSELLNALPNLKQALDGQLGHSELSQLIADIQAQVLELNSLSQDIFGDLAGEVDNMAAGITQIETDALLSSMQVDSSMFAQPELAFGLHTLSFAATLDGLFTMPEAFPLTLDFSNPSSIQEASELFASAGNSSSISSSASNSETDTGLFGFNSSSSDPS